MRFTLKVHRDGRDFTVNVAADGAGLVSHAGAGLLGEIADRVGLTRELSLVLGGLRERRGRHDPGRVQRACVSRSARVTELASPDE